MQTVVLASSNKGKLAEFQHLFSAYNLDIIPQSQFQLVDAEETAVTFVENALIKARHAAKLTGLPALADDSGLVVDALGGAPGVLSARYAGEHGDSKRNIEKLLTALKDVSSPQRTARFVCVLTYVRHWDDPLPIIAQGLWEGSILMAPKGEQGFGYDPVFLIPDSTCSAAELPFEQKNQLSHRARALRYFMQQWDLLCNGC